MGQYKAALEVIQKISAIHPQFEGLEDYVTRLKKAVAASVI